LWKNDIHLILHCALSGRYRLSFAKTRNAIKELIRQMAAQSLP